MHFIVLGYGRVGRALVRRLTSQNHSVAVISNNQKLLDEVTESASISKIKGYGFDPEVLTRANVQNAFAFAAVTDNDNLNILATRVAREQFGVEKVVARIYDSKRADIFERLGVPTVAAVRWTTDQVLRQIIPIGATDEYRDPSGNIALLQVDYDNSWISHRVAEVEHFTGAKVAFITRFGESFLVESNTVVQQNDILHILAPYERKSDISHILTKRFELIGGDQ
jgi:trk system potassium uptake protein TrkA